MDFILGNTFAGCSNLQNIIITGSNVDIYQDAFSGCTATVTYNGKSYTSSEYSELYKN